jgi:hypothetical protein
VGERVEGAGSEAGRDVTGQQFVGAAAEQGGSAGGFLVFGWGKMGDAGGDLAGDVGHRGGPGGLKLFVFEG